MSMALRVAIAAALVLASLLFSAVSGARTFRVYTCSVGDDHASLGPTIGDPNVPSGWHADSSSLTIVEINDRCPSGDEFTFQVTGPTMMAGQTIVARWTAAPATRLVGLSAAWKAESDLSPGRGQGTGQVTAGTDQQSLFAQNTPLSVWYGIMGAPRFAPAIVPAQWFELRFRCLDQCATTTVNTFRGGVFQAQFDVDDSAAPVGGLTGAASDAQTWSHVMRLGLNGADLGGGLFRAVVEADGADALANPLGGLGDLSRPRPRTRSQRFAAAQPCPLRIDNGSLDIDTSRCRRASTWCGCCSRMRRGIGPRSSGRSRGPSPRAMRSGRGRIPLCAVRPTAMAPATWRGSRAHWGRRGSRTLLVSPFGRTHVVRGRLRTADGAPIANAAIDMVSKTTAVNARELAKRAGPRTGADGRWHLVLPASVSSRDVTFRYRSHVNDTIASATASVRLACGPGCAWRSIRAARGRGRRSASAAGCWAARCRAAASRSC